tara:strand:- start:27 stop:578 length:552 start_codon:yes stop_codon:yes gene_type:complete
MALVLNGSNDTITGLQINSANIVNGSIIAEDLATGVGGKLLQIPLFVIKTDLYSTSTTGSFSDITGLTLTITPTATSSKILILANLCHSITSTSDYAYRLLRGSTALGNSTVGSEGTRVGISCGTTNSSRGDGYSIHFLDSPNTTSATTYKIQVNHQNGTYSLNSRNGQWDGSSTLMVMEVGA